MAVAIGDKTFLGQWRERLYFILTLALLLSAVAVLVTAVVAAAATWSATRHIARLDIGDVLRAECAD